MQKLYLFLLIILLGLQIGCSSSIPSYDEPQPPYDKYKVFLDSSFSYPTGEFHNGNYVQAKSLLWSYLNEDTSLVNFEAYIFLSQTYHLLGDSDSGRIVIKNAIERIKNDLKDEKNAADSGYFSFRLGELDEYLNTYPVFPDYLKKDNGFVPYDSLPFPIKGLRELSKSVNYPYKARRKGIEGRVEILAEIDENGFVSSAFVIESLMPECDKEALKAVLKTKFSIPKRKGKIERTYIVVPIVFKLL